MPILTERLSLSPMTDGDLTALIEDDRSLVSSGLVFPEPFNQVVDFLQPPTEDAAVRAGDDALAWLARLHFGRFAGLKTITALGADHVLYRLFHQEGARTGEPASLNDCCTCNEARLTAIMRQFPAAELRDMVEPDGFLHARCQFCARNYLIAPERVG